MDSLFETLDYRAWLQQQYAARKAASRSYSYRVFADAVGLDQSQLAKILAGRMHLAREHVPAFVRYLDLQGAEAEYFECLVALGRSTTPVEAKTWLDRLDGSRPARFRCLAANQLRYFVSWYHPVVRALVAIDPSIAPAQVAARLLPTISTAEAKESLGLLEELGLVLPAGKGRRKVVDAHVGTGKVFAPLIVRDYHRQVLEMALRSLDAVPVEERDVSNLVVGLDEAALLDIKQLTREFRTAVQKRIDQVAEADRVYQINIQAIPVTRKL